MTQLAQQEMLTSPPLLVEEDPFQIGWRYVKRSLPDGSETYDEIPLREEDLLYPEEGDYVVQKPPHSRDATYFHGALKSFQARQPGVVVLLDCRVDWGPRGVRPLGPDVTVLFDVREWLQKGTFQIAEEGGSPVLAIEVTSPNTWKNDVGPKIDLFFRAGVEGYLIVDHGPNGEGPTQLLVFRRGPEWWERLMPDDQGRLSLAPLPLLVGLENGRPWLYEAQTGKRLPEWEELNEALTEEAQARAAAEARAREEAQARAEAEVKAREAEAKVREETQARAALEERLRQLEAQLREGGKGPG